MRFEGHCLRAGGACLREEDSGGLVMQVGRRGGPGRGAWWTSLVATLLVALVALLGGVLASAPVAGAATYSGTANCYRNWSISVACETGIVQYEDLGTLTVPAMYQQYGVNITDLGIMKAFSGSTGCSTFVGAGYFWRGPATTSPLVYLSWKTTPSGMVHFETAIPVAAGAKFPVYVAYDGGGKYTTYADGYSRTVASLGYGTCYATAGTEVQIGSGNLSDVTLTTNVFSNLRFYDSSWNLHSGFSTFYIRYPCGLANTPPYCFNGVSSSGGQVWQSNKPG